MNDTKQLILKTAIRLFLQKTFREVTMNEIVDATGLSKGAFYHYFTSKEELFLETVSNYVEGTMTMDWSGYSKSSLYDFFNDYMTNVSEKLKELGMNSVTRTTSIITACFLTRLSFLRS